MLVLVLAVGVGRLRERTADWANDEALYTAAVAVCPDSAKNHHQLGQIFENSGRHQLALQEYHRAQQIDGEFCDVDQNIGQHHIRECQEAVRSLLECC